MKKTAIMFTILFLTGVISAQAPYNSNPLFNSSESGPSFSLINFNNLKMSHELVYSYSSHTGNAAYYLNKIQYGFGNNWLFNLEMGVGTNQGDMGFSNVSKADIFIKDASLSYSGKNFSLQFHYSRNVRGLNDFDSFNDSFLTNDW